MTPKIKRIMPSMVPSRWLIKEYVVVTKRDHASNSVLGLGWGARVAQAVNTPEIGRARRPIRIQLVVLVDDEDDVILKNCLLRAVLGYFLERTEIRIAKSSEQFRLSLSRL